MFVGRSVSSTRSTLLQALCVYACPRVVLVTLRGTALTYRAVLELTVDPSTTLTKTISAPTEDHEGREEEIEL